VRRRKEISRQVRDDGEELSEKELKKQKRQEAVEKRRNARKKDKVTRWGGLILLGLVMFAGFLLWVSGEMKSDPTTPAATQGQGVESVIVR